MADTKEKMTQVVIYVPPSVLRSVDQVCAGTSRSKWILAAIEEKLARERAESGQGAG